MNFVNAVFFLVKINMIFLFWIHLFFVPGKSFSQNVSCRYPDSSEILGNTHYSICDGSLVDLQVSSESIQSPVFNWYEDENLTSLVFVGDVFQLQVTDSKDFFVTVEGTNVCKSTREETKKISITVLPLPIAPILPEGNSYFSPQGVGLEITPKLDASQTFDDFDLVFYNSYDQIIFTGKKLQISSSLPRGTYYYSVISKNKSSGCSSEKVVFSVIVEDPNIKLENCSSASSYTIPNLNCPGCNVQNPSFAVDSDMETYSQILTEINPYNGFIGQNLIFPNLGYQGDSVKVFLSFSEPNPSIADLISISLTLMDGTRKVSKNEIYLNSPLLSVKNTNGIISFSFLADLINATDPYVSVLVKSYSSSKKIVPLFNIHSTQIVLATPVYSLEPINICQGESALLAVQKGENTYLRWYTNKDDQYEVGSGLDFQSPILNSPGDYIYWLAVFRSNCESPVRIPITIHVFPRPIALDLILESNKLYCEGDRLEFSPEIDPSSPFFGKAVSFNWYYDPLGNNGVSTSSDLNAPNIFSDERGSLVISESIHGDYVFYVSTTSPDGCESLPSEFKKITFTVSPYPLDPVFELDSVDLCEDDSPKILDLNLQFGPNLVWFSEEGSNSPLPENEALIHGATYFARSISSSGCLSAGSVPILIQLKNCLPILDLKKTAASYQSISGDSIRYLFQINNSGIKTSYDLVLRDTLLSGTVFISTDGFGTYDSGVVEWHLDSLEGGSSREFYLDLLVQADVKEGTVLVNTAFLESREIAGRPISSSSPSVLVSSRSELALTKDLLGDTLRYVGDEISYLIRISNTGPSTAYDLEVKDVLPAFLGHVSSPGGVWNATDRTVSWKIPRLGVGQELEYELKVRALSAASGFKNRVSILDSKGSEVGSDESPALTIEKKVPVLGLLKRVQGNASDVLAGEKITYELILSNTGLGTSYDLVLRDTLPSGTVFMSTDGFGTYDSGVVEWHLDSLEGGSSREFYLELLVQADVKEGAVLVNTAFLESREIAGSPISSSSPSVLVSSRSELALTKDLLGDTLRYVGDEISYLIRISNTGPSTAYDLEVKDVLPAFLGHVSSPGGVWNATDRTVSWKIPRLGVGQELEYELKVRALSAASGFSNNVFLYNRSGDQILDSDSKPIEIENKEIQILLEKTLDPQSSFVIGDTVLYKILVKNLSNFQVDGINLVDSLNSNLTFIESNPQVVSYNSNILRWEGINLAPDEVLEIIYKVVISENRDLIGSIIKNNVSLFVNDAEETWDSSVEFIVKDRLKPVLIASKMSENDKYNIGDIIIYKIEINNIGDATAYNVTVKDVFPSGLTFLGIREDYDVLVYDGYIEFVIPQIDKNQETEIHLSFILNELRDELINKVELEGKDFEKVSVVSNPVNLFEVDLEIKKKVEAPVIRVSNNFIYTLMVTNNSNDTSRDIIVTDSLPNAVDNFKVISGEGTVYFNQNENILTWSILNLEPRDSVRLEFQVNARLESDEVVNHSYVTSKEFEINMEDNKSSTVHSQVNIKFPNVFTPNNDGFNDLLVIKGIEYLPNNRITIINRWGVQVYKKDNYQNDWNGGDLNEGVYFYTFKWENDLGFVNEITGYVTIIRD